MLNKVRLLTDQKKSLFEKFWSLAWTLLFDLFVISNNFGDALLLLLNCQVELFVKMGSFKFKNLLLIFRKAWFCH